MLTIFDNFDHFQQSWQFLTILTIFDNLNNFWQFWQFWPFLQFFTILTILTFFYNFDNFWQLTTIFTIQTIDFAILTIEKTILETCERSWFVSKGWSNKKQAAGTGTSRYSFGIKSWPELDENNLFTPWRKIAIVWATFGHLTCSLWEPIQPKHSWPMWDQGFKPF